MAIPACTVRMGGLLHIIDLSAVPSQIKYIQIWNSRVFPYYFVSSRINVYTFTGNIYTITTRRP